MSSARSGNGNPKEITQKHHNATLSFPRKRETSETASNLILGLILKMDPGSSPG
ncbi:MAG: hypothetical protein HOI10_11635 [Deltaproteobacteria bacterium]|nr:hypothetical protein [Deltaproteobacteria bacterium]